MKKNNKKIIIIISVIVIAVIILYLYSTGFFKTKYQCPDGTWTDDYTLCEENNTQTKITEEKEQTYIPTYIKKSFVIYEDEESINMESTNLLTDYQGGDLKIEIFADTEIDYRLTSGTNCVLQDTSILKEGSIKQGSIEWFADAPQNRICIKLINKNFIDWDNINPVNVEIKVYEIREVLAENTDYQTDQQEGGKQETENKCPASCDDRNKCTYDYCTFETDFKCVHQKLERCCGNNICENTDECINCFYDCYTCEGHDCIAINNQCKDRELYVSTTSEGIRIEVPTNYITEAEWFGNIETTTLQKIKQVYGFEPKTPITYRFVKSDLSDYNYVFNPQSNNIIIPAYSTEPSLLTLKKYYEESQDLSLLEVHEMIHAINFANCELVTYSPTGEEHKESKLPLWTEEGLAMIMEIWIPYYYGNEYDKTESRYEPQKTSTIDNWEDKNSNFWKLVNNADAYGYEHARGSVLLHSWFKYGLTESQIKQFVSALFNECKIVDRKIDDEKIVGLWNNVINRDDTPLFKEVGIIN